MYEMYGIVPSELKVWVNASIVHKKNSCPVMLTNLRCSWCFGSETKFTACVVEAT